jgi:hypothetical protein
MGGLICNGQDFGGHGADIISAIASIMNPIGSEAQRQRFFPKEHSQIIIIGHAG